MSDTPTPTTDRFAYDLESVNSPESYVRFVEFLQQGISRKILANFGGQVEGRVGLPVCLVYSRATHQPSLSTTLPQLIEFCLNSGSGLEIADGDAHAVAIPYGLILSHYLYRDCLYHPCQVPETAVVTPEDYVMKTIAEPLMPLPARNMLDRVLRYFVPNITPRALMFEGRDPVPFQAITFNVYKDMLSGADQIQHLEGLLRWYLPPSLLVRVYDKTPDLADELEAAPPLVVREATTENQGVH